MSHTPVLLKETIEVLNPQIGNFFIDGTLGSGGHAEAILKKIGPKGKLLGIDWDNESLERFKLKVKSLKFEGKLILVHGNYADLLEILQSAEVRGLNADKRRMLKADGLILDLGFSSEQLKGKGFSFLTDEVLDMRYDAGAKSSKFKVESLTAAEVVNSFSEKDLAEIFWQYGEERHSRRIAKEIVKSRKTKKIKTTFDLVEIIKKSVPLRHNRLHPATRVFQALRIYVNQELNNLDKLLRNIDKIVKGRKIKGPARNATHSVAGGRIAIISYHSLEDRLVKNRFRELKKQGKARILTSKPIRPTLKEIKENPRSRSAKLRAVKML